jgi:hypothetical protein
LPGSDCPPGNKCKATPAASAISASPLGGPIHRADRAAEMMTVATRAMREEDGIGGAGRGAGVSPRQSQKPVSRLSLLIGTASGSGGFAASINPLLAPITSV